MTTRDSDSGTEQHAEVELRWVDPFELEQSRLYEDNPSRGSKHLTQSVESLGIIEPLRGLMEGGRIVYFEGGRRIEAAREAGEKVPIWLPKNDIWTEEKVLLTRLLSNTGALSEETDWLRRAWLLEDWWERKGETQQPSPSEVSEILGISEATASRWVEPVKSRWERTLVDRDMFDEEQIFQPESSTNELIGGLNIDTTIENVNPLRLQDINAIVYHSTHRERNRKLRVKLLNRYVRNDIDHDELKQLKERVQNENIPALEALKRIRQNEEQSLDLNLDDELARNITVLSEQTGKDEAEILTEGAERLIEEEQIELGQQEDTLPEYVGQFDFLDANVDRPLPEPDLSMVSNKQMANLPPEDITLTVTSPPYNVAWDYGETATDNLPYAEYLDDLIQEPFSEVYRLTVPGGYCCIVVPLIVDVENDDMQTPEGTSITADVIDVLTDEGWNLFDLVIWDKGYNEAGLRNQEFPYPESKLNNFSEVIVVLRKPGEREVSKERRKQSKIKRRDTVSDRDLRDNVWHISPTTWEPQYTETSDTAQFPEELAKRCILHWSYVGDTVLDPFCGRGTTLKMAKRLYRESIGFEIQEELERDIQEYVGIS